jgi:hypothetical protein
MHLKSPPYPRGTLHAEDDLPCASARGDDGLVGSRDAANDPLPDGHQPAGIDRGQSPSTPGHNEAHPTEMKKLRQDSRSFSRPLLLPQSPDEVELPSGAHHAAPQRAAEKEEVRTADVHVVWTGGCAYLSPRAGHGPAQRWQRPGPSPWPRNSSLRRAGFGPGRVHPGQI